MSAPADWQLPPGVSRGVWDYLHDADLARTVDAALAGTPLLELDLEFAKRQIAIGSRVLDLGCGTGRVAVPLAARGDRVTGVDLSLEMLRIARAKAAAAGVCVDFLDASVVELDSLRDGVFDAAVCLFSTLGMVSGVEARQRVVGHAFRLVRPGGVFVLHVHNRWHHLRTSAGRRWLAGDVLRSLWRALGRRPDVSGDFAMPHSAEGHTGWTMHLFTRREVVGLVRAAGFHIVEVLPLGLAANGRLPAQWLVPGWRAYGFLLVCVVPR
ncbi:MAG: class I SAM-dependent methyltransferase [Gemmataceae bacterium]